MGNLWDRLLNGKVVDFLLVYLGSYPWPAFNVADSAIVVGAGLLVVEILFAKTPARKIGLRRCEVRVAGSPSPLDHCPLTTNHSPLLFRAILRSTSSFQDSRAGRTAP